MKKSWVWSKLAKNEPMGLTNMGDAAALLGLACVNCMVVVGVYSRRKGQNLFLRPFSGSLRHIQEKKIQVSPIHNAIVGSSMTTHTMIELGFSIVELLFHFCSGNLKMLGIFLSVYLRQLKV